ncbi:MAG: Ger(x)C family spore germination protein [Bacilli bacterium]|nr:Ger(x)C family spore germination protein [Bacilli bacterium]
MKNKILITLLLCFCLCGCNNYRELNDMAIITVVSIDKTDDKYELSFLVANARNSQTTSKEGEAQTTVYSGKGNTLLEAAEHIDFKSPKKLYLGHINVVIISEQIGKEGFLKVSDFLMRYPETRKQFFLMQTRDCKAKDVLQMVSPLESFPSQHIASLLKSNRDSESVTQITDYATFVSKTLEKGIDPMIPVITIVGNKNKVVS